MTRALVRGESILTQLLFDHSLRLRMKDTTEDDDTTNDDTKSNSGLSGEAPLITVEEVIDAAPAAPEDLVHGDPADDGNGKASSTGSGESTEVGSSGGMKDKDTGNHAMADKEADKVSGQGLAGKINVLMAADVESVLEGRDLPLVLVYTPVQLVLAIWFLYKILSWSSLVGLFVLVATMPIPGWLTKKNAEFQQKRMLATDARIDSITEAVGALRMIKMFGWEERIKGRVAVKREAELTLIWQRRLMTLYVSGFLFDTRMT